MGPQGSQGVQGLPGEDGQPGPGTRVVRSGTLDSTGSGGVHLPEGVGTISNPPSVSCYIADSASANTWLVIATSNVAGACGLVGDGDHVDVAIVNSEPFWAFRIVAVY